MASIRKSFSFRNGVQVDEDNFIVNANGLVGIGTSIPNEALDVRGTAKVVGLTTTNDLFVAGVATATNVQVGTAISITGGGIKATNFYGDGATLSNLPTSQWKDVDVGLGFTSIHAVGNVGIATTDPRSSFQVGGTPGVAGKRGVGINSIGNIQASGIVTATSFVGALTGNVVGNITGNVDGNINATGVSTVGVITATGTIFGAGGINVTGGAISVPAGDVIAAGGQLGNLRVGTTEDNTITSSTGNLILDSASGTTQINDDLSVTGNITGNVTGNVTGNITGDIVSGVTTASTAVNVGTGGTALAALNTGRVGIGSAIPKSDLTIRKTSDASLEIVGESGQTKVSLGKSDTDGNESALIRYGNPDGSLNFVNYNPGSVNTFIHAGTSTGIQTGRFSWIYGQNNSELLSLTHEGKVGVGKTNPDFNLEVVGTSTITSDLGVGGNLEVDGNVTLTGSITLPPVIETNLNAATGISTLNNVSIGGTVGIETSVFGQTSTALFNRIGIQTDTFEPLIGLRVNARSEFNFIGIGTTASPDHFFPLAGGSDGLHLFDKVVGFNSVTTYMQQTDIGSSTDVTVGIGTSVAAAAIDFRFAGNKVGAANTTGRFMIPPTVTTDEKVGLATQPGGIVYDLTLNKLQCFNGTTWNNLF